MGEPLRLGTKTQWGEIAAVGIRDGERYYMMVRGKNEVNLMPGHVVEEQAVRSLREGRE